jgi:hypothetical protein
MLSRSKPLRVLAGKRWAVLGTIAAIFVVVVATVPLFCMTKSPPTAANPRSLPGLSSSAVGNVVEFEDEFT